MSYRDFALKLRRAWCAETSSRPWEWTAKNPAAWQCAVTALIVQDTFGGLILFTKAKRPDRQIIGHYYNQVGGINIDFTRSQFPKGTAFLKGHEDPRDCETTRDYIMSHIDTIRRYHLLASRIEIN